MPTISGMMTSIRFTFLTSQEAERVADLMDTMPEARRWFAIPTWNHVELRRIDGGMLTASDLIQIGELMIRQSWKKTA